MSAFAPLEVQDLVVEYTGVDYPVRPLDGLSFHAHDAELGVVLGPSGCGKTTLLSCLSGLLTPTSGRMSVFGEDVGKLHGDALAEYRRHTVGVVFQAFNLIPSLSALHNVMAPLRVAGVRPGAARRRAVELLEQVGLGDRMDHRPSAMSGGQQQRVAIARALVHDPPLVVADEPTAHLDFVQVEGILRLLRDLAAPGRVVLVATHDDRISRIADRVIDLGACHTDVAPEPVRVILEPGEVLFNLGDRSDLVYVVEAGEMEIFRSSLSGVDERLAVVGPRQYFGELGPLLRMPRSASARALWHTELIGYPPDQFSDRTKGIARATARRNGLIAETAPKRRPRPY